MEQAILQLAKQIVQQQAELERLRAQLKRKTPKEKIEEEASRKERVLRLVIRMYKQQEKQALKQHATKIKELSELAKKTGIEIGKFGLTTEHWNEMLKNFK
ncbi:hypothetical protein [Sphingobacterium sp. LRF_L2]|uniref:hypothetical protein n=1 Tax=Sphingobacterium sp. LRF_L2 TaxID=3369421 RepID=UPI003F5E4E09